MVKNIWALHLTKTLISLTGTTSVVAHPKQDELRQDNKSPETGMEKEHPHPSALGPGWGSYAEPSAQTSQAGEKRRRKPSHPAKKSLEIVAFAPPVGLSAPALSLLRGHSPRLRDKAVLAASRCPPVPATAQLLGDTNPAAARPGSRLEKRRGSWTQSLFLCCSGWFLNHRV